jgi:hypothetical protein
MATPGRLTSTPGLFADSASEAFAPACGGGGTLRVAVGFATFVTGEVCWEIGASVRLGVLIVERFAISSPIQFFIISCCIMLPFDAGDNASYVRHHALHVHKHTHKNTHETAEALTTT